MSAPFISEIRAFGFNFAPIGWAQCDGQLLPISQFDALFAVIGTTYGGNGQTTFGLPNLMGNAAMYWGNGPGLTPRQIGQVLGTDSVTLTVGQMPSHMHTIIGAQAPTGGTSEQTPLAGNQSFLGNVAPGFIYNNGTPAPTFQAFSPKAISLTGGSQPHDNMQPFLVLNFCMALEGIFPSRS